MGVLNWLAQHWFDTLQTLAIVVSFGVTAYTLRRDQRVRRLSNTFEINRQHRDLWLSFSQRPELARIFESTAENEGISTVETEFINLVILHLKLAHYAMREKLYEPPEGLSDDIRHFFTKPIPRRVWEEKKRFHGAAFTAFLEKHL